MNNMDIVTIIYVLTEIREMLPSSAKIHRRALDEAISYMHLIYTNEVRH